MQHEYDKAVIDKCEHYYHALISLVWLEDLLKVRVQVTECQHEQYCREDTSQSISSL